MISFPVKNDSHFSSSSPILLLFCKCKVCFNDLRHKQLSVLNTFDSCALIRIAFATLPKLNKVLGKQYSFTIPQLWWVQIQNFFPLLTFVSKWFGKLVVERAKWGWRVENKSVFFSKLKSNFRYYKWSPKISILVMTTQNHFGMPSPSIHEEVSDTQIPHWVKSILDTYLDYLYLKFCDVSNFIDR